MADENINQPVTPPENNRAEERITQLSDKVKAEAEARKAAEDKAAANERRAIFAEGFADIVSIHPAAKDFKADIETKVNAGYSVEDAAFAVLGKAGKLGSPTVAPIIPAATQVAGGSSVTAPTSGGAKSLQEMTTAEKRAELEKLLVIS